MLGIMHTISMYSSWSNHCPIVLLFSFCSAESYPKILQLQSHNETPCTWVGRQCVRIRVWTRLAGCTLLVYLQYSAADATPEAAQTSPLVTRSPRPVRWLTNDRGALDIRAAFRDHPSSHRLPISRRHRVHLIVCHLYRENRINDTQLIRWHESSERKGNNDYL